MLKRKNVRNKYLKIFSFYAFKCQYNSKLCWNDQFFFSTVQFIKEQAFTKQPGIKRSVYRSFIYQTRITYDSIRNNPTWDFHDSHTLNNKKDPLAKELLSNTVNTKCKWNKYLCINIIEECMCFFYNPIQIALKWNIIAIASQ